MGLKEILEKQGGVNLLRQYWNGGAFLQQWENFCSWEKAELHWKYYATQLP